MMLDTDMYMLYAMLGGGLVFGVLGFVWGSFYGAKNNVNIENDYSKVKADITAIEDKLKALVSKRKK